MKDKNPMDEADRWFRRCKRLAAAIYRSDETGVSSRADRAALARAIKSGDRWIAETGHICDRAAAVNTWIESVHHDNPPSSRWMVDGEPFE